MKKYKITVMSPSTYPYNFELTADINPNDKGFYEIVNKSGKIKYLPINLTLIEEL